MNLSPHFSLAELTASETALRAGIDNTPPPGVLANLKRLAVTLEAVRDQANGPLYISSGYRCLAVNRLVGSGDTSAHVLGLAADITAARLTPRQLATAIRDTGIVFDQLILEFDRWVHIGLSTAAPRRQILTARRINGKTVYLAGLV